MAPLNTPVPAGGGTRSLVKGGAAGLAGAAVNAASQFLIVVAVTRGLDARTAGCFFTATTLCLMAVGILRLDAGNGLIYFIARSHGSGYRDVSRFIRAAVVPVAGVSIAATAVVVIFADPIGAALMSGAEPAMPGAALTPGPEPATLGPALRVLALALPVMVCADVLLSATRGFGTMRPTVFLGGMLQPGAQLVHVTTLALTGVTAGWTLSAAWAAPALPVLVLSALLLHRRLPSGPHIPDCGHRFGQVPEPGRGFQHAPGPGREFRRVSGSAGEFWRYTAPRALGGAAQAVFQRLDIVIVAVLAGPEEAALYTAATRFKVAGQLVNQGFAQAVQPRLVRAMAEGDLRLARRLYQTTTMWLVLLTWPVWLGYALLAPWLLRAFGDGYRDGAAVAVVLAATMMLATACGMVDVVLIAAGHTASSMANILGAIAVTVALDVVLVPSHGALGAALGWSGGMLAKNLLPLFKIARLYGLRPFGAHSLPSLRPWRPEEAR
ncbi:lipopolysaccharide biosynthesis protein [Sphaerisporangium perillae]|uniref:lipopolysaccharide biosynthesis protein n=1 Tax=Sphaerisporangium perillae TaxID=2935860 RepID=UPI00200DD53B|nr:lipopolysaccharide biosynthesis protein [Sphaerisporangium perillae]